MIRGLVFFFLREGERERGREREKERGGGWKKVFQLLMATYSVCIEGLIARSGVLSCDGLFDWGLCVEFSGDGVGV